MIWEAETVLRRNQADRKNERILWKHISDAADDIHTSYGGIKPGPNPVFLGFTSIQRGDSELQRSTQCQINPLCRFCHL